MAEFTYVPEQEVAPGGNFILNDSIPCKKGYVLHRAGSGIVTLRGIVNSPCNRFARYELFFKSNIAVPEGQTPGELSIALAIDGEPIPTSIAITTPTVAGAYFNVVGSATIDLPAGCCYIASIENLSTIPINGQKTLLRTRREA